MPKCSPQHCKEITDKLWIDISSNDITVIGPLITPNEARELARELEKAADAVDAKDAAGTVPA